MKETITTGFNTLVLQTDECVGRTSQYAVT
ncbi:hypothetical protein DFR44_13713 [Hydromonas duriensis]|uniref:Uncharacterized protein n=1 Tax=Hydromonas duriensis TaxID=1527608 RepID=A0A4R6Y4K3_9BURK|nr:hypothetical protein DFR44_13713 [Hydromonas duriensis]